MKTYTEICNIVDKNVFLTKEVQYRRTALIMYTNDNTWAVTIRHTSPRKLKEFKSFHNAAYYAYRLGAISLVQVAGENMSHDDVASHGLVFSHIMLDPDAFKGSHAIVD